METRICYQERVNAGAPQACSVEKFNELLDSPLVKKICEQIEALDKTAPDYEEKKGALKRRLPVLIPHACGFKNGKRKSEDAIPSGLVMLDVDHVDDPCGWFFAFTKKIAQTGSFAAVEATSGSALPTTTANSCVGDPIKKWFVENGVYLVAVTPSGKGLRIIGERNGEESIEAAMARLAKALGIDTYDAVTKDLARASYMMPREYVLWVYEAWLCGWPSEEIANYWQNETEPIQTARTMTATDADDAALKGDAHGANLGAGSTEHGTTEKPVMEMPGTVTAAEELCFKGIPYSEIVEQLMTSIGANGGAVQGERNTVYFSLANYMRYICDFDAALMLRVLPDFGLAVEERKQAIHSALGRPRKVSMPVVLQSALSLCERAQSLTLGPSPEGEGRWGIGTQAQMTMPVLPPLMKMICDRLPEAYRPAMVIASLPVLGALATRIRFAYLDSQEHSLSFFSCITAPAASGKSFIRQPIQLLLTPIDEQDRVEREKEQVYKERLRASKNSKNQPEDPRACPRNNGVNISIAKLLQLLTYSEGKHLIGIGEEMDTLVKSERAGVWSQKSDIYRLAFDNAEYGQAYMSDQSFSAHVPVFYNLMMTGTPNSMKRFFKDLENGLATRVCFAQLPDTSFSEIPVFAPYTEEEKQEIVRWARVLDMEKGEVRCEVVNKTIGEWLEAKRQQAIECDSRAMDTFRRRSAVIGFRAGMLAYLLYGHPDQRSKKQSVNRQKEIAAFAEWVAEYVFRGQMELWGQQMEQELGGGFEQCYDAPIASLLGQLPEEFETSQLIALRAKNGQSVKTKSVAMVLSRWKQSGKVQKIADNRYKKVSN